MRVIIGQPVRHQLFRRLPLMGAVATLHVGCYWVVTRVTAARGPSALLDTASALDRLVPYLPDTWPLYWLAYPFILIGAGGALLRLPDRAFQRAIRGLSVMTLMGAAVQLLLPARAPWPSNPALPQQWFHASALVLPYATLPSMHVAYSTVAAGLLGAVSFRVAVRATAVIVVGLVTLATLTLKEHVVLDAITGLGLGLATLGWWRRGVA